MINVVLVAMGGALGASARYAIGMVLPPFDAGLGRSFPVPTLCVNVVGCFLIGLFAAWLFADASLNQSAKLFVVTGVLGGFTTYSTFGLEAVLLVQAGRIGHAALYVGLCAALLPVVTAVGWLAGRGMGG